MSPKAYELIKSLEEYFAYGFPVYATSLISDGPETFSDRVAELLRESPTDNQHW